MDHVSKDVRSKIMAAVHSRGNTTTELPLGKILWAANLRGYRKHWPVVGKPDFAWPGRKVAVFVDGCFWHGCRCKYLPRTNTKFWRNKIETNKRRDRRVSQSLRRGGWAVVRVKECAVRKPSTLARIGAAVLIGRADRAIAPSVTPSPRSLNRKPQTHLPGRSNKRGESKSPTHR